MTHQEQLAAAIATQAQTIHGKLDTATGLLRSVLFELARRPQPFAADCANNAFITPRETRGVVRFVHNPTAAPLTITLFDGSNPAGLPEYSATLAPGDSRHVYVVFRTGLFCAAGAGGVASGEYDA